MSKTNFLFYLIFRGKNINRRKVMKIFKNFKNQEKIREAKAFLAALYLAAAFSFFPVFYPPEDKADAAGKNIIAEESGARQVVLGGDAFGIKLYSKGVMVVEISSVETAQGEKSPAKDAGIKESDIITEANSLQLQSNEELSKIISESNQEGVVLKIQRGSETFETTLYPAEDINGTVRAGMWIRDSAAGLGTITYYDTENSSFGSLGHGICDADTEEIIPLEKGQVLSATITDADKSVKGEAGGLKGYFNTDIIGEAVVNCDSGLYGVCEIDPSVSRQTIQTAGREEVHQGEAQIYCTVEGTVPRYYDIYIEKVNTDGEKTKNMVIEITDPELLEKTGGIVQGMSGSPIIQNGKLVGAVTHVFVNRPEKGYGIFIENMLEISDSVNR